MLEFGNTADKLIGCVPVVPVQTFVQNDIICGLCLNLVNFGCFAPSRCERFH